MKKARIFVTILLVLVIATASVFAQGGGEKGDKVYTLKLSTQLNETSPMVEGFKELAESVKARSEGRLLVEIYPSAQLGSDEDVIEQALHVNFQQTGKPLGNITNIS